MARSESGASARLRLLLNEHRTPHGGILLGCSCEGFRMPAVRELMPLAPGPASESLQGTNPRDDVTGELPQTLWGFG